MSEQYVIELSGLPYFRGNFVQPCSFPIFNFSENRVEFFLCERSNVEEEFFVKITGEGEIFFKC